MRARKQPKRPAGIPEWVSQASEAQASEILVNRALAQHATAPILLCPNCFRKSVRTPKIGAHSAQCAVCSAFYNRYRSELTREMKRFLPKDALSYLKHRARIAAYAYVLPNSPVAQRVPQLRQQLDEAYVSGEPITETLEEMTYHDAV